MVGQMIDKNNFPVRLEGKSVILEEIQPKYFSYVIEWRNNPELNKFLNQPFKLTQELEKKWFEEVYLKDDTQGLWIIIDKEKNIPFGTTGYTDLDRENRTIIGARLLLGNESYAHHQAFLESCFVSADYIYRLADIQYGHVVKNNRRAFRLNKVVGFIPNTSEIKYPQELLVNGMEQIELYRTKEMYLKTRKKIFENLNDSLFS